MINKTLMSILVIVFAFFGLSFITDEQTKCVNLYIDYASLDNNTKSTKCLAANNEVTALDVLKQANLQIEGTKKYGLSVICRVNGLPNAKIESCDTMPSEKAYWAVIIKEKQFLPFPTKEWGWGQLAIDQQYLSPGDSLGLVWTGPNGELRFP